jgi:death-on-curing protein
MTAMKEPVWILPDAVLAMHRRQIAEHGGEDGLRDAGLLDSGLNRPKNLLAYGDPKPDLPSLAAAYAYGITRNHPFVDGNKRTAYVVCRTFLLLNSHDLDAPVPDKYLTFLKLAEGSLSEDELADWLRRHLCKNLR